MGGINLAYRRIWLLTLHRCPRPSWIDVTMCTVAVCMHAHVCVHDMSCVCVHAFYRCAYVWVYMFVMCAQLYISNGIKIYIVTIIGQIIKWFSILNTLSANKKISHNMPAMNLLSTFVADVYVLDENAHLEWAEVVFNKASNLL